MSDEAPKASAGWYPDPNGGRRYWDGEQWLDIPEPEQNPQTPEKAKQPSRRNRWSRRRKIWVTIAIVGVLILGGGGTGIAMKIQSDQAAAEKLAAQEAVEAQEAADAKAEADAEKAEQDRQDAADELEREVRDEAVTEIETSVKTMAEGHVADGVVDAPVLEVSCDPVDGGSTDDLTQKTTVFQCFVANEDNGDGTMSGYYYNATMNWDSGSFTYGLGQP